MALVFEVKDGDPAGPALHALIIGVGAYPHLKDGSGTPLPDLGRFGAPGQLTSPPRSALAWTDALIAARDEWLAPLGTVDLLVSSPPKPADDGGDDHEPATRDAIQSAFGRWWKRCDRHADNIALFVFCGHGLQAESQVLLAADFGHDEHSPWMKAFDFDRTRLAFMANHARTQLFVVDACREVTLANLETPVPYAPPLREPGKRDPLRCEFDFTARATSRKRSAYGKPNEPSYFTKALLRGLDGGAASRIRREWLVTTGDLAGHLDALMAMVDAPVGQQPQVTTTRSARIRRTPAPLAHLRVDCKPSRATGQADFSWHHDSLPARSRPVRSGEAWTVPDIPVGASTVAASFPELDYHDVKQKFIVFPPIYEDYVEVSARTQVHEIERP
ncbi:caspase family protein [Actinoplanes sp. NPDC026619]|uniref:caspase family protein n=1 Tax=Actinoplanes sp. NPDC026619 TaxID=3155798 RepID=UPI0033F07B5C